MSLEELAVANKLCFTNDLDELRACRVFIVTVPTPVDGAKRQDMSPLIKASATVGKVMPEGVLVISELIVYPGATEEVCVPVLGKAGIKVLTNERSVLFDVKGILSAEAIDGLL